MNEIMVFIFSGAALFAFGSGISALRRKRRRERFINRLMEG